MNREKKTTDALKLGLVIISALCGLVGASCDSPTVNSATVDISTGGGGGGGGGGGSTTSCPAGSTSTLIDAGLKGPINIYRGLYSDIKLLPGASTETPLIAYSDGSSATVGAASTSSNSVKFAWWNGTGFTTEVVAGDPYATYVRLAVLSTGIPIVVWSQYLAGTTPTAYLKVAMRSAAPPASGTWTVAKLDSTTTLTAALNIGPIEVSVSPNNDVLVAYGITTSTTVQKPRYLDCPGPCSAVSSFQAMGSGDYVDTTNTFNTALTQIGAAWCNDGGSYLPALAYSITSGDTRGAYAVCTGTMTQCLAGTDWSVDQSGFGSTGGATSPTAVSLFLDPTESGDEPKIAVGKSSTGIYTYYPTTATTCYGTGTSGGFSPSSAVLGGDTKAGASWIKILKDTQSTPGYHIVASDTTTSQSVSYFNQVATGDPFNNSSDWNPTTTVAPGVLETLATASYGGAAISTSTSTPNIFVSYALTAAPYDLRMAVVGNYTAATNATTDPDAVYDHYDVDESGPVGMPGNFSTVSQAERNAAVALTSKGVPGVAYVDFSYNGVAYNATAPYAAGRLKYAYQGSTEQNGGWTVNLIDGAASPQFPSIAFDSNDHPWISFYDSGLAGFFLATNEYTDGSGQWEIYEFPVVPGAAVAIPSTNDTSLAMYTSGGVRYPVMSVINSSGDKVESAMFNPSTGTWSGPTTAGSLYEVSSLGASGAAYLSQDYDSSGDIFMAYYNLTATAGIYVSYSPSGSGWLTPVEISPPGGDVVAGLTIRINPVTGVPAIAWDDLTAGKIYFLQCSASSAIACGLGGWSGTPTVVDSTTGTWETAAVPTLWGTATPESYGLDQLTQAALVYSASGVPSIFYTHAPTEGTYGGNLLEATYNGGSWSADPTIVGPIYGASANANMTTSAGSTAGNGVNFGGLGLATVATESSSGATIAVSLGMGNALYATSCGL